MKSKVCLIAQGGYTPPNLLTNHDLENRLDTSDQWIRSRTGILQRRICSDDESTIDIAAASFLDMHKRNPTISIDAIDAVVFCTATPDLGLAPSATSFAHKVGIENAFCFDLNAACSGFVYGLSVGFEFMSSSKRYRNVLVVGADKMSAIVDPNDRTTCVLFGDGGGCVLLGRDYEYGIEDYKISSDGRDVEKLCCPAGGSKTPLGTSNYKPSDQYLKQDGGYVFRKAVHQMTLSSCQILERHQITMDQIDWFLPHQANMRIINKVSENLNISKDKVLCNIDRFGNTTHGTIPLLISDYANRFKRGDKLLVTAFGAGFTWGSIYLTWA